jgi:DNA-3-methyladenine glycosylase
VTLWDVGEATLLRQAFFAREVDEVARDLIGRFLVRDRGTEDQVVLRIVEVEAYGGPEDSASHCRSGRTARNSPMWGPPGHAYVYLCYGLHHMLNIVTGESGRGQAVLVRACEVVSGSATVSSRRGGRVGPKVLAGPGKVAAALSLDRRFSGAPLYVPGALEVHEGVPVSDAEIATGPRVGIEYASARDRAAERRYALAGSPAISSPRSGLKPRRST